MTIYGSGYRPKFVTQRDGSALANSNCRCASIAMGLAYDADPQGSKTSTGSKMRSYMDDQSGGTGSDDASQAWDRGYDESLRVRDGHTFADALADLKAGRIVHLDVWAAKMSGSPCISGSGAYGHTIAVLPDVNADGWAVGDPWCTDGYHRIAESSLRAAAEYWGGQVYSLAADEADYPSGGPPPTDPRVLAIVRRIVRRLMTQYDPSHPAPEPPGRDTGGGAILFTTTRAVTEDDVERPLFGATGKLLTIPAGTKHYEYPGGPQTGTIGDPAGTTVYRIVAQDARDSPSWYLIDGGAPGQMRWIYRADVD
jgi:hypothetical protein